MCPSDVPSLDGQRDHEEQPWTPPAVWVSDDRTVLVNEYANGTRTVAMRSDPDAIWGPPILLVKEAG